MNNDKHLMINGKEYSVIFTVENKEYGKEYIAYTDGNINEHGRTQIFFSAFTKNENGIVLIPASPDEQQCIIHDVMECLLADLSDSLDELE